MRRIFFPLRADACTYDEAKCIDKQQTANINNFIEMLASWEVKLASGSIAIIGIAKLMAEEAMTPDSRAVWARQDK